MRFELDICYTLMISGCWFISNALVHFRVRIRKLFTYAYDNDYI